MKKISESGKAAQSNDEALTELSLFHMQYWFAKNQNVEICFEHIWWNSKKVAHWRQHKGSPREQYLAIMKGFLNQTGLV